METPIRIFVLGRDDSDVGSTSLLMLFAKNLEHVESPVFLSWSGSPEAAEDRDPKTLRFQNTQRRRQQTKNHKVDSKTNKQLPPCKGFSA